MRVSGILALLAFAGIAALSFHGFNEFIADKAEGLEYMQKYAENKGPLPLTGLPALDSFASQMIYMFRDHILTNNQLQWWIFAEWSAVFGALSWLNVEFTRTQMRFVWLYFFLWNFAGLAPFLALVFIYYVIAKESQISNGRPDRQMTVIHSFLTSSRVLAGFAVPILLRMVASNSLEYGQIIFSFMVIPTAVDAIWAFLPTAPIRSSNGDGTVSKLIMRISFLVAAVVGAYLHLKETNELLQAYGGLPRIIQTQGSELLVDLTRTGGMRLIAYDAPLSFASIFVFIAYDGGLFAALTALVTSLLFSPSVAFAVYFSGRSVFLGSSSKKHD
eukprot:TRINITY_DN12638_c0_g1_i1.p1 TRINITY_DN12638_c0_g1~~TRINITY_DN12638_c0_g1_i1.p1  ORF type:complete len:331 (-),score=63.48 TRINITY_DN12638_c0_g1_i1:20-1012(-)